MECVTVPNRSLALGQRSPWPGIDSKFISGSDDGAEIRLDWTERAQRVESYLTFLRHSSTPEQGSSDVRLRLRMLDVEKRKVRFFVFF